MTRRESPDISDAPSVTTPSRTTSGEATPEPRGTDPDREAEFTELLAARKRGDPAALRELYDRLVPPVASYLRVRGVADLEDLTSEVFLAVFTGLDRFRGGEPELRAWVLTIAHHRWVDLQRRSSRQLPTTVYEPVSDPRRADSAETEGLEQLGTQRVHDLLSLLSADQQDVLMLRLVDDLTVEQVAKIVGKRTGAVKALQRRGLAALRKLIDEDGVPL